MAAARAPSYDVFLSYRRSDAAVVERIAEMLTAAGVRPFLDRWELVPGEVWQEALEQALDDSGACAVMIGPAGPGPWATEEMRSALEDRARRPAYRVIPVFLPGADPVPESLPRFLRRFTVCVFDRADDPEAMHRLLAGIRGEPPGRGVPATRPAATKARASLRQTLGVESFTWRRARVVAEALDAFGTTPLPIVLHGLSGMGKTVAACHVVEELNAGGREVIAVPAPPAIATGSTWMLDFLDRGGAPVPHRGTLLERIAEVASRDVVLVLDGLSLAPGGWEAAVLDSLSTGTRALVVITSDRRPEADRPVHAVAVPPLSGPESIEFIEHYAKLFRLELEPARLAQEVRPALLSHPIALRALLGQARSTPAGLLATSLARTTPPGLAAGLIAGLDACDLQALAVADVVAGAPVASLIRASVPLPPAFEESLSRLVERCLVQPVADTIEVPALVSDAIGRTHPDQRAAAAAGVLAAIVEANRDAVCPPDVLAAVCAAVAARAAARNDWEMVANLCSEPLLERVNVHGRWTEYLLLLRLRVAAADGTRSAETQIDCRLRLIRKLAQTRDFSGAWETLHAVEGIIERSAPERRAQYLCHRGFLNHLERNAQAALADLHAALALHRQRGDEAGLLIAHKLLGHLHLGRHDYEQAAPPYREALGLARRLGDTKQRLEIEASLAVCELHLDGPEPAEARLRRVVDEMSAGEYLPELARALLNLTVVLESQDRFAEARETALRGTRIATPDGAVTSILQAMADRISRRVQAALSDRGGRS